MKIDRKYQIVQAENIVTKNGPTVLLSIKDAPYNIVKFFMPKRYSTVFFYEGIESINSQRVILHLVYKGLRSKSNSYILGIDSNKIFFSGALQ
jgi:hypothetical protein